MQRVSVGSLLRGERVFQQRLDGVQLLYLPLLLFPRLAHLLLIFKLFKSFVMSYSSLNLI